MLCVVCWIDEHHFLPLHQLCAWIFKFPELGLSHSRRPLALANGLIERDCDRVPLWSSDATVRLSASLSTLGSTVSSSSAARARPEVHLLVSGAKVGLYAWLSDDEAVRLQRPDNREAQDWLNCLELGEARSSI